MDALLIKMKKRGIRDSTLANYKRLLLKINNIITGKEFTNMDFVVNKFKELETFLEKQSTSVRKNYINAILVGLTPDTKTQPPKKYEIVYKKLSEMLIVEQNKYVEAKKTNTKNEKEDRNWMPWTDIMKFYKKLERNIKKTVSLKRQQIGNKAMEELKQYLVLSLYTLIPPRRNEYADMKIINTENYNKLDENTKKKNVYLINNSRNKKQFHFGSDSVKSAGSKDYNTFNIPTALNTVINLYLHFHKKEHPNTDFLLLDSKGKKMTKNGLTKYINKIFEPTGKAISTSMLRKIFLSHKFADEKERQNQKLKLAKQMNHSTGTQQSVYVKFD